MPQDPDDFDDEEFEADDETEDEPEEKFVKLSRKDIRRLERKAKEGDKAAARIAELEKERAFDKAKVNVDTPQGKFFAKHYDGDLDPALIQAAAKDLGVPLTEELPAEGPELEDGEKDSTQERQDASTGGAPDGGKEFKPDPREEAIKAGKAKIDAGRSEEEGLAAAFSTMATAAAEGDERALVQE